MVCRDNGSLDLSFGQAMKLEMGLVGRVLMTPGLFEPLVTDTWLKWLWLDCLQFGLQIQTDLPELMPNHLHDVELMQVFAQHGFRSQDLSALNWCRMFLKVIWVSDICDG